MPSLLKTSIEYLKGVGPQRAELLKKELGIFTYEDLLMHIPFRYVDRSRFYQINQIQPNETEIQLRGKITRVEEVGQKRGKRLVARFSDGTGEVELIWFQGQRWIKPLLNHNSEYVVFGKPGIFNGRINFVHPEIEVVDPAKPASLMVGLQPVYSSTEKLNARALHSRGISRLTAEVIKQVFEVIPEVLPASLLARLKLMPRNLAFRHIHFPKSEEHLNSARYRLKFEEFFVTQLSLLGQKKFNKEVNRGFVFSAVGNRFNDFYQHHLPFELTGAQKRVLKEIRQDTLSGSQMNRLVQGDVGSGKTIVALMSMLLALDNGFQACLMAPTEILARQHFDGITELVGKMGVTVEVLTGSSKTAKRKKLLAALAEGEIDILIGTHALIEDPVIFKNLGMAIIDEQHRFGVAQRAALWKKNTLPPHVLVMTATPIPRTLAMSVYGDLDLSVIDELPPGRKPVKTLHKFDTHRLAVFDFMKKQIELGRQVYVVYPLIDESESMDYKDLMDGYESICRAFPLSQFRVSIVHGKMKPEDKDYEMERFVKGETQIMVATTVIEVGVNVPNASVMVIESAERFGLSQLHQLRGRVGRGADQSYCILMTGLKLTRDARTRMETMVRTNDGFEIADTDLKLRGPGDMLGTRQSGSLNLVIADIAKDAPILQHARSEAQALIEADPTLQHPENKALRMELLKKGDGKTPWARIS